jgi:Cft2 family RNA processing exonuclease
LELKVRKRGGIIVEYGDQGIILDPTRKATDYPIFVTHAHADHASAFKYPERKKYATKETYELLKAMRWKGLNGLHPIKVGDKVTINDFDVKVHNSGHILGGIQYEILTPGGSILYTGDLCTEKTFTMEPATPKHCDILVIESTFGSPIFKFPKRKELAIKIYQWVINTITNKRIPAFKTDSIGNAQEIISILNTFTNLSVVTSSTVSRITNVYQNAGYNLDSLDINSDEGKEALNSGKCAVIIPKGSKLDFDDLDIALASGWAAVMRKSSISFPLSDHADYKGLLSFIRRCKPKRVLTFHGGDITKDFHFHVKRLLELPAAPLSSKIETINGPLMKNEMRAKACSLQLTRTIRIPGFLYHKEWLVKEMGRLGFSEDETENGIQLLIDRGILRGTEMGFIFIKTT